VLTLVSIGVVEIEFLKKQRKIVYFVMAVAAAFIAPGDIVISMLSLLIPVLAEREIPKTKDQVSK
jgi:Sec-independent protein secretion pathway component TatC